MCDLAQIPNAKPIVRMMCKIIRTFLYFSMDLDMFRLSADGLSNACALEDQDFTFEVGGVEYKCCRFQACFFSKRIARMLAGDKTVNRVIIDFDDKNKVFHDVMALMNGESIEITSKNVHFLEMFALDFENDELLSHIESRREQQDLTIGNALNRVKSKRAFGHGCKQELEFIASHFHELRNEDLVELNVDDLEYILQSPSLKLSTEEQLLDSLLELQTKVDRRYSVLLRYIQFQFLKPESLQRFLDLIFPELLDMTLWKSICSCLQTFTQRKDTDLLVSSRRYLSDACTCENGPFVGILAHLRDKAGCNVFEKGLVKITASSNQTRCHHMVEDSNEWWYSHNTANSYVLLDFKSYRVALSGYSLKSDGEGVGHLVSWVVEGSESGERGTWELLDKRETDDLDDDYMVATYECNQRNHNFYRFIRVRQTGKNSYGSDYFKLTQLELFGKVVTAG